jgi:hypothetical protein
MDEGILQIKLMDWPVPGMSQGKNSMNGGRLGDGAECLVVINAETLGEPTKHLASLVSVQGTIHMKLMLEDPFAGDHIRLGKTRNEIPSVVVQ